MKKMLSLLAAAALTASLAGCGASKSYASASRPAIAETAEGAYGDSDDLDAVGFGAPGSFYAGTQRLFRLSACHCRLFEQVLCPESDFFIPDAWSGIVSIDADVDNFGFGMEMVCKNAAAG